MKLQDDFSMFKLICLTNDLSKLFSIFLVERDENGQVLQRARCVRCALGHHPGNSGRQCLPCRFPPLSSTSTDIENESFCNCTLRAGVCLPEDLVI